MASTPPDVVIDLAITVTCRPSRLRCAKSQRGVVIYRPELLPDRAAILATGGNGPPEPFRCGGVEDCGRHCNRVAVHAEERAIIRAHCDVSDADLVHVKVVDGDLVVSGGPSCWQCSRMVLQSGLRGVWLFRSVGWRFYPAVDFHALTLAHHNMPRRQVTRSDG